MSLTLSVTSSSTLFVTNIPTSVTSLTFASSPDGSTYTDIGSAITVPVGTTAYSLTNTLIPSFYYRVTTSGSATATVQYILQTRGATGSSTSSFSSAGTGTPPIVAATSVTLNATNNAVVSDQTYSSSQAVYYQLTTPVGSLMGNGNYTMSLFSGTFATNQNGGSSSSAYFRVTTSGSSTNIRLFRRDAQADETLLIPEISVTTPTQLALYWDGTDMVYYYVGNVLRTTFRFGTAWSTIRAAVQVAALATPYTLTDMRLYVTGGVPTVTNWRLNIQAVTGLTLTSATSPAISTATYGRYYNITNSGFNALTLPSITAATDTGAFWVLRNNTSSYLSVSLTGATGLSSPMVIPPSNAVTIIWNGTAYVLF